MFAKPGQSGLTMDVVVTRVRVRSAAQCRLVGLHGGQ